MYSWSPLSWSTPGASTEPRWLVIPAPLWSLRIGRLIRYVDSVNIRLIRTVPPFRSTLKEQSYPTRSVPITRRPEGPSLSSYPPSESSSEDLSQTTISSSGTPIPTSPATTATSLWLVIREFMAFTFMANVSPSGRKGRGTSILPRPSGHIWPCPT